MLITARNKQLNELIRGYALGTTPLKTPYPKSVSKFGLLRNNESGSLDRVGFGHADEVFFLFFFGKGNRMQIVSFVLGEGDPGDEIV